MRRLFLVLSAILLANLSLPTYAKVEYESGSLPLKCGNNNAQVNYKISKESSKASGEKFAILIDGSPLTKFFSDNNNNYLKIAQGLWESGYIIFEIRYPVQQEKYNFNAQGFYAACYHQGLENIKEHAALLYDSAVKILGYEQNNLEHKIVALGFSIGAVLLQNMAFSKGKHFDNIALTGVLLGDVEKGCEHGLKVIEYTKQTSKSFSYSENIFTGLSWASFMDLVQVISLSGQGCCLKNSCKNIKNEYTSSYNFEKQPYFAASNLAMFEGMITQNAHSSLLKSAANPAQVNYIAQKRKIAQARTQRFFYPQCDHSIINCAGTQGVKDILGFLNSGL